MNASRYVVVGAGLAGAATARSLARRGHEVTLVERTQPAARDGSSHGSARIFRYAYPDPFYARLVYTLGPEAEAISPPAFREMVRTLIQGALDRYSTGG